MFGKKYSMLTPFKMGNGREYRNKTSMFWVPSLLCECDCGEIIDVDYYKLKSGHSKSCGCYRKINSKKLFTTHGRSKTKEYRSWRHMLSRCYNKNHPRYEDWGGRGISVCARWATSFELFFKDMGPCPKDKYSLDRINNNKNYSPSNCRWASAKEQNANKRPRGPNKLKQGSN
jgi:hypothetical protein